MEVLEREYRTVDKSEWGEGSWRNEPDKVQWIDHDTGLDCLAVRHQHSGHWCGYVGVPESHPLHGQSYSDFYDVDLDFRVHGGLTFSEGCDEEGDEFTNICHVPFDGRSDNVWWFGFDCAHSGDLSPQRTVYNKKKFEEERAKGNSGWPWGPLMGLEEEYRTLEYVKVECKSLAAQLVTVTSYTPPIREED